MAAAGNALRLCLRAYSLAPAGRLAASKTPVPVAARRSIVQQQQQQQQQRRTFAATPTSRARNSSSQEGDDESTPNPYYHLEDAFKDLSPQELKQLEESIRDLGDETESGKPIGLNQYLESEESGLRQEHFIDQALKDIAKHPKANRDSFWYDKNDPETLTEDEDTNDNFNEDDITSMAHSKLDEIREQRHYARVAAWEMPLLSKLAKPFEPPTAQTPLRFRYTTYMGEFHPAEKKVVVQFSPDDLPDMTELQRSKLKKLAGPRYNPEENVVKMSCESFEQAAQNKRYLSDQLDTLTATAKDSKDTFEDVPLDTRHHKVVKKPKFPKEWRLTEERQRELAAMRAEAMRVDAGKTAQGQLVDGVQAIEALLAGHEEQTKEAEAEMVTVGAARKGPKGPKGADRPPKRKL